LSLFAKGFYSRFYSNGEKIADTNVIFNRYVCIKSYLHGDDTREEWTQLNSKDREGCMNTSVHGFAISQRYDYTTLIYCCNFFNIGSKR
jgi:hypothetical protein